MIDLKNMSILIVDDVKSMRSILRKMLKNLHIGKFIHMAENGREGLTILHSTRIDLAIIDWKMPVMDGPRMLESIRQDRRLRDLPVLMVTAESEKEIVLEAAEIEVEGYLIKPLTPAVLDEKIKTIIHQANHPDKAARHVRKARTLEESGDFSSAVEHMKHAVALRPGASRILRKLGLVYGKSGDDEAMKKCLEKAASVNPQDVMTRYLLGEACWKDNDLITAADYFLEVLSMTRKYTDRAMELGQALMESELSLAAKNIFNQIISNAPQNLAVKEKIVDICIENKELKYAKQVLDKALRDFPSSLELIGKTGLVCEMTEDLDGALEHYLALDKAQFGRIDIKLKIARIYFKNNKILQADNYLNQVLEKDPGNEEALDLRRLL